MENIRIKPVWPKSKETIWNEMFEHIDEQTSVQGRKIRFQGRIPLWGYAAGFLIPLLLACHFYTVTTETANGEQTVVLLPDRSTVTLNVAGKLSYNPIEWFVSRKVKLEGEAYFDVRHGSRFCVQSGCNRVYVLGTTFNVYARQEMYRVTCLTGKVAVHAGGSSAVLNPDMQATFRDRKLSIDSDVTPDVATGWMQGMFVFVERPLQEVLAEVERQYNIHISPASPISPTNTYTGIFSKTGNSPEDVIKVISKALGITLRIE